MLLTPTTILALATVTVAAPSQIFARQSTTCGSLPAGYSPAAVSLLPDPFTFANNTKVTTKAGWACRQQEISQIFQLDELGVKPGKPSTFTATFASNTLTINCGEAGKSISFTASISYPASGTKPYPAIIAVGGLSIPTPSGVAVITLKNDEIAAQNGGSSRGQGKFYTLYGSGHSAGAMMAWAWAASRIIDALEVTTATNNINLSRIGVSGCSRNGKGAFVIGAFEPRIALTIPQESGSGGAACWRVSDSQHAAGANIQTASEIVGENVWFSTSFNSYATGATRLPVDHHELAGLVAPRGLFVIENDIDWLGPVSTTVCMKVGQSIYTAAGASDAMGFSLVGGHGHCSFPASQQGSLNAFVDKYLRGGSSSTAGISTSYNGANPASWVTGTYPVLT